MREIKFRAFEKTENLLIGVKTFYFPYKSVLLDDGEEYYFDEVELMQYTGLNDKNGVCIFEGDIVSLADCEPSLYKIVWWENNFKYGIEYIGNDTTNWKEESLEEFSSKLIEVIGNIYENKELLDD